MSKRKDVVAVVADALARRRSGSFHPSLGMPGDIETLPEDRADATAALDAALLAMMEPSEEMVAHALEKLDENGRYVSRGYIDRGDAITAFTAMLTTLQAKA